MNLDKLTPLFVVDEIEHCLKTWEKLGYSVMVRVPEEGRLGFVILKGLAGELMLQTRASLADDLPEVAARRPTYLLYANVGSLTAATQTLKGAKIIVPHRKTFYGATEAWVELEDGIILGLSEHSS